MTTTKGYSTVKSLMEYLGILKTIPNKDSTSKEEVGTGDNTTAIFWLDQSGIIESTYTISYGLTESSVTDLVETTDYVIDLDTSKITLTTTGITTVGTNKIFAVYSYNSEEILNSEALKSLNAAENKIERVTEQVFADGTADDPGYKKISNEIKIGNYNPYDKVFETIFNPIIMIDTTVNGAYTTGGTEITLTSATGLPEVGTIYIGDNKVSYTAKTTNVLTIPATTPSIDDGAVVRGEVVELSKESEGSDPSYSVLEPNVDYEIDYIQGKIKIFANAYWGELAGEDRLYPSNYLVRITYMNAWRNYGENATIPDEIEEITNMIAAKKFVQRIIKKAYITGMNEFKPTMVNSGDEAINEALEYYKPLNVGTSQADKQRLS